MNCKVEHVEISEVTERMHTYSFALLYCISQTVLCAAEKLGSIVMTDGSDTISFSGKDLLITECTEVRIFSTTGEIHLFHNDENGWEAVVISDDGPQVDTVTRTYELDGRFGENRFVEVKEYLDYDQDGQAYVRLTRLADILGSEESK